MISYTLLPDGAGVALERNGGLVYTDMPVRFDGLPTEDTMMVCFESPNGTKYVKPSEDGVCAIPLAMLLGRIKVVVHRMTGEAFPRRWVCEDIEAQKTKDGGAYAYVADSKVAQYVAELKAENEAIRNRLADAEGRISALENRISDIFDGYDIT